MKRLAIAILVLFALAGSVSAKDNKIDLTFPDGQEIYVRYSSDPEVPNENARHHLFLSCYSKGNKAALENYTISLSSSGSFYFKPFKNTTNKAGMLYGDCIVTRRTGIDWIRMKVTVTRPDGAIAEGSFNHPATPRTPISGQVTNSGSISGSYSLNYDVTGPNNDVFVWDSESGIFECKMYREGGKTNITLDGAHWINSGASADISRGDLGDTVSCYIIQAIGQCCTARADYSEPTIARIPSKAVAVITINVEGEVAGGCTAYEGIASATARLTMTSPLITGEHALDIKGEQKHPPRPNEDGFRELIPYSTFTGEKVISGYAAVSNAFSGSSTVLVSGDLGDSNRLITTARALALGRVNVSWKIYEVPPMPI